MDELATPRVRDALREPTYGAPGPGYETITAVFGEYRRRGGWVVPEEIRLGAYFGSVVLDFTRASLPESGCVEIDARVVFGELKLIVPRSTEVALDVQHTVLSDVREPSEGGPLPVRLYRWLTGDDPEADTELDVEADPLAVTVTGTVVLGTIKVTYR